jgi:hypothetical protein
MVHDNGEQRKTGNTFLNAESLLEELYEAEEKTIG